MIENKLKTLNVKYDEYIESLNDNAPHVRLHVSCAVALCRKGYARTPLVWTLVLSLYLCPVLAIALPFFVSIWWSLVCVIAIPILINRVRRAMVTAVFNFLRDSSQPYEIRAQAYSILVEHNGLLADQWRPTKITHE